MLLRSKIDDDRTLVLELAEGWDDPHPNVAPETGIPQPKVSVYRFIRGSTVDVPDMFWSHPQIQGAIKTNVIELDGKEPTIPEKKVFGKNEPTVRIKNISNARIAFECIKDYVDPGNILYVPESKLNELEIRNAISYGLVENIDAQKKKNVRGSPVVLDEVSLSPNTSRSKKSKPNSLKRAAEVELVTEEKATEPEDVKLEDDKPEPKEPVQKEITVADMDCLNSLFNAEDDVPGDF